MSPEVFKDPTFRRLTPEEEQSVSEAYKHDLLAGLRGESSSLAMTPSLLDSVEISKLPNDKTVLVIEIGGTHLYGGHFTIQDGKPHVDRGLKIEMKRKQFKDVEDFMEMLTTELEPVLSGTSADALGLVFSFSGKSVKTERGVDVLSRHNEKLSKGITIPGIGSKPVGELLLQKLSKKYHYKKDLPVVTTNDTVAVALSAGTSIGVIVATGFNLAVKTSQGIVNTESGGFNKVPKHELAEQVDRESTTPGRALAEKQIAGAYLGKQFAIATGSTDQSSERISEVLVNVNESDSYKIAQILRERSSQIVGILIGTAILTFSEEFPEDVVSIPVEGSLFWGMVGYAGMTKAFAEKTSGKKINFLKIPESGRVGIGLAALSFVK